MHEGHDNTQSFQTQPAFLFHFEHSFQTLGFGMKVLSILALCTLCCELVTVK